MKKLALFISCQIYCLSSQTQELDIGLSMGTNAYQRTYYSGAMFVPANTYFVYHEAIEGEGLIDKHNALNSFNIGAVFSYEYKRLTAAIEPQFLIQRSKFKFEKEYPISRIVGKKCFRMPIYGTFKFFKKKNSVYVLFGAVLNKDQNFDIQDPGSLDAAIGGNPAYDDIPDFGDYHMYGLLYDEYIYWNGIMGLGRKFNRWNFSARYSRPLNFTKHNVLAGTWQIELHLAVSLLSSRDFTKKHYLYVG